MARDIARSREPRQGAREVVQRRGPAPGKRTMTQAFRGEPAAEPTAPASGGRPLPPRLQTEMQSLLGIDLADIRIHEDGQASQAGALAYTRGTDIHFAPGQYDPDSQRGRELIGHELAHVAQQARGTVAATIEIDGLPVNADAGLEGEADRIGAQVARGESVAEPGGSLQTPAVGAVAQRKEDLDGNPSELTDASGNPTTDHRTPSLSSAENAPKTASAASVSRQTQVMVLASHAHPFSAPSIFQPPAALLYLETTATPPPAGYSAITGFDGTVAAPHVDQEATRSIYIGGTPNPDDVKQGNLGDCYFLAALMSMAQRDPGKIKSMIKPDGAGGATISLWRCEERTPTIVQRILGEAPEHDWTQVDVKVTDELAFELSRGAVLGAALRAAPAPTRSEHWADQVGSKLEVHRKDLYDCARWAPLFEKAYARFAESHGRYGGAVADPRANPTSGIEGIGDGGHSGSALKVLYGPAADDAELRRVETNWTGGSDLVAVNAPVMDQLILLERDAEGANAPDAPILTASTSAAATIRRLGIAIMVAQFDPAWDSIGEARQALLGAARVLVATWLQLPPDPEGAASRPKEDTEKALGDLCAHAIRPGFAESAAEQERYGDIAGAVPTPIPFAIGDDSVPASSASQLAALNQMLQQERHPKVAVRADGYASGDAVADPQALSQRRADAVETELLSGGAVEPHVVAAAGHGESPGGPRVEMVAVQSGEASNPLLDPTASQPIRDLADLLLDMRNNGTDNSTGQRNVYTGHAYSVVAVKIAMANDVEVPLGAVPATVRHSLYPLVDPSVSTVTLRNPHHTNEPDRHDSNTPARGADGARDPGDGDPSGEKSDGTFRMSLRQFFLNFSAVTSGVLPKS